MDKNQFSQNAISHKELNDFFIKAKKEISPIDSSKSEKSKEEKDFNDLVKNWTDTSQRILLMMKNKEKFFTNKTNPKSLMAFGAMGAHINMALQALKSTEYDQWKLKLVNLLHKKLK